MYPTDTLTYKDPILELRYPSVLSFKYSALNSSLKPIENLQDSSLIHKHDLVFLAGLISLISLLTFGFLAFKFSLPLFINSSNPLQETIEQETYIQKAVV